MPLQSLEASRMTEDSASVSKVTGCELESLACPLLKVIGILPNCSHVALQNEHTHTWVWSIIETNRLPVRMYDLRVECRNNVCKKGYLLVCCAFKCLETVAKTWIYRNTKMYCNTSQPSQPSQQSNMRSVEIKWSQLSHQFIAMNIFQALLE